MEQVGPEVRRIRQERGLSQRQLALRSSVDRATLNQVELGRRTPTIDTLEKLAGALDAEVADFFPRAQPDLFDLAVQTEREAKEAEAAGAKMIRLSDDDGTRLMDQVAAGDTEGLEAEAAQLEAMYGKAVQAHGADDEITTRLASALVITLAGLALARGGTLEDVKGAILRALAAYEHAHASAEEPGA